MIPRSTAVVTATVRSSTPSFERMHSTDVPNAVARIAPNNPRKAGGVSTTVPERKPQLELMTENQ
jgi:hypothetical protein